MLNQWTHGVSYDGSRLSGFVDGVFVERLFVNGNLVAIL